MKKLESIISKNGFKYELIKRDEKRATYAQYTKDGLCLVGYEVFKIQTTCGTKFRQFAGETFPKDSEFGRTAWSIPNFGNQARCWLRADMVYSGL